MSQSVLTPQAGRETARHADHAFKEARQRLVSESLDRVASLRESHVEKLTELGALIDSATSKLEAAQKNLLPAFAKDTLSFLLDLHHGFSPTSSIEVRQGDYESILNKTLARLNVGSPGYIKKMSGALGELAKDPDQSELLQKGVTQLRTRIAPQAENTIRFMCSDLRHSLEPLVLQVRKICSQGPQIDPSLVHEYNQLETALNKLNGVVEQQQGILMESLRAILRADASSEPEAMVHEKLKSLSESAEWDTLRQALSTLADKVLDRRGQVPASIRAARTQHAEKSLALLHTPPPSRSTEERLILEYFSVKESLANWASTLAATTQMKTGQSGELSAVASEMIQHFQTQETQILEQILKLDRKARGRASKALAQESKASGLSLVPDTIDDSYWRDRTAARASGKSTPPSESGFTDVRSAIAPYSTGNTRSGGIKTKDFVRQLRAGTVEKTVEALREIIPNEDLRTEILKANPKLFLEYQDEPRRFGAYTEILHLAAATIYGYLQAGGELSVRDIASIDALEAWIAKLAQIESFKQEKADVEELLRARGFDNPEIALVVLRKGGLLKSRYETVSNTFFDHNARNAVSNLYKHEVASIRKQLANQGFLVAAKGEAISYPTHSDGDIGKVITWIKDNLPSADPL